jgi:hypothetical protein
MAAILAGLCIRMIDGSGLLCFNCFGIQRRRTDRQLDLDNVPGAVDNSLEIGNPWRP